MIDKERKDFYSNPGSPIRIEYAPKVREDGVIELVEDGVVNIQEFIDSFRESADVSMIVKRYQATGDASLLERRSGFFADATQFPETLAQALQLQIDSNRLFESLPIETRAKYNHDANQFFAKSGSKEWFENMKEFLPKDVQERMFPESEGDEK